MQVLTVNGDRLIEVVEVIVHPWVRDGQKRCPQEWSGWSSACQDIKYCVTGYCKIRARWDSHEGAIQLSRFFQTREEALKCLIQYAKSGQIDFFYQDYLEEKVRKNDGTDTTVKAIRRDEVRAGKDATVCMEPEGVY